MATRVPGSAQGSLCGGGAPGSSLCGGGAPGSSPGDARRGVAASPDDLVLPSSFRRVLVTVGTTKFDALIEAIDCARAGRALRALGCRELVLQCGDAPEIPHRLADLLRQEEGREEGAETRPKGGERGEEASPPPGGASSPLSPALASGCSLSCSGMRVRAFRYAPTLAVEMAAADLVVSHAGAGSLFEALAARKTVLAVPNGLLMDDHQTELVQKLADARVLLGCRGPDAVVDALWALARREGGERAEEGKGQGGKGEQEGKGQGDKGEQEGKGQGGKGEQEGGEEGKGEQVRGAAGAGEEGAGSVGGERKKGLSARPSSPPPRGLSLRAYRPGTGEELARAIDRTVFGA